MTMNNFRGDFNVLEVWEMQKLAYTEIFGFTGIIFNGIPGLTEYF